MANSSSSSSPSSSAATSSAHQWKYDVFLSFRGEDTRDHFVSHLYAALSEKGIETFIDYQLRKGQEIAPSLLQAIQESNIAVIIFSEDYASSSWCLDELVKVMECHETYGQVVIPVFYHVDPSDVRKQTGSFAKPFDLKSNAAFTRIASLVAEGFAELFGFQSKENFEINSEKVQKWKATLTKAANLVGWDSKVIRPERELINQIVKHVLQILEQALPTGLENLVGMNSRIEEIKKRVMWEKSMKGLYNLVRRTTPSSFAYICEKSGHMLTDKMDELACFASGMPALRSSDYGPAESRKFLSLAEEIVILVFYHVDPSDVRKQTGSFAEYSSDRKRKRNFETYSEKVSKWKAALTAAANLPGWESKVISFGLFMAGQSVNLLTKLLMMFWRS